MHHCDIFFSHHQYLLLPHVLTTLKKQRPRVDTWFMFVNHASVSKPIKSNLWFKLSFDSSWRELRPRSTSQQSESCSRPDLFTKQERL